MTDNLGNVTCFAYDSLHWPLSSQVASGPYAAPTSATYWVYDAATEPGGSAVLNVKGTLAEAYTCSGNCSQKLTDMFFSSTTSKRGNHIDRAGINATLRGFLQVSSNPVSERISLRSTSQCEGLGLGSTLWFSAKMQIYVEPRNI